MSGEGMQDVDRFSQCLGSKLETLKQELLQAHFQVVESLNAQAPNQLRSEYSEISSVCGEYQDAVNDAPSSKMQQVNAVIPIFAPQELRPSAGHAGGIVDIDDWSPKPKDHCGVERSPPSKESHHEMKAQHQNGNGSQRATSTKSICKTRTASSEVDQQRQKSMSSAMTMSSITASKQVSMASVFTEETLEDEPLDPNSLMLHTETTAETADFTRNPILESMRPTRLETDMSENLTEMIMAGSTTAPPQKLPDLPVRPQWVVAKHVAKVSRRAKFQIRLDEALDSVRRRKGQRGSAASLILGLRRFPLEDDPAQKWSWDSFECIIHPFSKLWITWEICGFLMVLHDVVMIPMQVFDMPPNVGIDVLKFSTMFYWTMTFCLTFFVSVKSKEGSAVITDHRQIALHYFKGWFALDLLLVAADWISYIIEVTTEGNGEGLGNARMARMARLGRIIRTVRLLRVMRIGEMLQQIESLIDSEYLSICFLLACNVAAILFLAHVAACTWFAIGDAGGQRSWLQRMKKVDKNLSSTVGDQYLYSLGWSLSTLLGNSVTRVYPETKVEYACALVILVSGAIAVSLVFSSTTAAMTRMQQLRAGERDAAHKLKQYLRQNHISVSLEARVMRYVDIAKTVHAKRIASDSVLLLNLLSGPLRLELQLELHAPHLTSHPFFKFYYLTNDRAMSELCLAAVGFIYLSRYDALFQTFTYANHMYFLVDGVMAYRRAKGARRTRPTVKIDKNNNFCEAAVWTPWVHRGSMRALIESHVLALNVGSFFDITNSHHDVFLHASEYAHAFVFNMNEQQAEDGYVWDVAAELMYPERFETPGTVRRQLRRQNIGHLSLLREAEALSADLMDFQSDSDSEDERTLLSTLSHPPQSRNTSNRFNLNSKRDFKSVML